MGNKGGIGKLWNKLKSGFTQFISLTPFTASATPVIGGVASMVKAAEVAGVSIPEPRFYDDVNDIDESDNVTTTFINRIMKHKALGIPIIPLMLGGVVLSYLFHGSR